jgi:hypothetical protein
MFNSEDKSLVGENCPQYISRNILHGTNATNLARNCTNCSNYLNGNCSINLFNNIYESLKVN